MLSKTVKATKVTKGSKEEVEQEDETMVVEKTADKDSEDEDSVEDVHMDVDGNQKTKVTTYGNSDSDVEEQTAAAKPDDDDDITHGSILKEKHSKYL
jgi:hypothetical protein